MEMIIRPSTTIDEFQQLFKHAYPGLRIVLYKFKKGRFSSAVKIKMPQSGLMKSGGVLNETVVSIFPGSTVADIEKIFKDRSGMIAEIRFMYGKIWKRAETSEERTIDVLNKLYYEY